MTMLWCPREILRYGGAKPLLLLISVSFLRQKLQGRLLSTAGTYPHFTQRVSDHVFVANSLSIYFPTNLIHLDSEVFFYFLPCWYHNVRDQKLIPIFQLVLHSSKLPDILQKMCSTHPNTVTSNPTKPWTLCRVGGTGKPGLESQTNKPWKCVSCT